MTQQEHHIQEAKQVNIPTIDQLKEIAKSNNFSIDETMSPLSEFQLYNLEKKSGFISMMTDDHTLFSIDIALGGDQTVVLVLSQVLKLYGLPVSHLIDDVAVCHTNHKNFVRNYTYYWVEYIPSDDSPDVVLVRYRKFVDE
ncbi:hypothetical protein ACQCN2_17165 [Brevibacillus ginsengisoli]|uniref:hypothetical protein n=1 Tax=Brevibacillus ginsengisoli TaxID=363854 RepID=UPI003CF08640